MFVATVAFARGTEMLRTSFRIGLHEDTRTLVVQSTYGRMAKMLGLRNGGIFHVSNVILRRLRNSYGIYVTGSAKRQQQNGNGMLETRHKFALTSIPTY